MTASASGPLPRRAPWDLAARRPVTAATLLASALALAYLAIAPASADLAAALYRSDLFARHGLLAWDGQWYAGHHAPGYSVLFPPLGALLGARVVGALSAVAAAALFAAIVRRHVGPAGALGSLWFAAGIGLSLLSGRMTYGLGIAVALGALALSARGNPLAGAVTAALSTLASPLAGAFLALVGVSWALAGRPPAKRAAVAGMALAAGALTPLVALVIAFPEGGREPFVASSFWPALALVVVVAAVSPRRAPAVRIGALLYALACVAAFAVPNALGGNAVRLGSLFAGPVVAAVAWDRRRLALLAVSLPLLYWQLAAPVRDVLAVSGDPSVTTGYYRPLLSFLAARSGAPFRIEIPFTHSHWEAYRVAAALPLARGWERQLDIADNGLFYRPRLSASDYRDWLTRTGVSYVAVADAPRDGSARAETALIARGLSYLRPVWRNRHWRVFAVEPPAPLAQGPGRLTRLGVDDFALQARHAGRFLVRERFTPYWAVVAGSGCVARAHDGWTTLQARRPGELRVGIRFSLARVGADGPRCSSADRLASASRR